MLSRILVVAALAVPMFADNDDWRRAAQRRLLRQG